MVIYLEVFNRVVIWGLIGIVELGVYVFLGERVVGVMSRRRHD